MSLLDCHQPCSLLRETPCSAEKGKADIAPSQCCQHSSVLFLLLWQPSHGYVCLLTNVASNLFKYNFCDLQNVLMHTVYPAPNLSRNAKICCFNYPLSTFDIFNQTSSDWFSAFDHLLVSLSILHIVWCMTWLWVVPWLLFLIFMPFAYLTLSEI